MIKHSQHSTAKAIMKDPLFWGPVAAAGAGVGFSVAQGAFEKFQRSREKARGFKEMLSLHPHLKKNRDPKQVRRIYNSLHNVNPMLARDPMVSGAWVDNVVEQSRQFGDQSNQALLGAVSDLAQVRAHMSKAKSDERRMRSVDAGALASGTIGQAISRYGDIKKEFGDLAAARADAEKFRGMGLESEHRRIAAERALARKSPEAHANLQRDYEDISRKGRFKKSSTTEGERLLAAIR